MTTRLLAAALAAGLFAAPVVADPPKVKLAVLVVFDQMRGDYVEKWRPQFGDGGFKRLQDQGAWFPDCHYPYASTSTGPGHASILAGCGPDKHGVLENDWYDRAAGRGAYCAGSTRYETIPPPPKAPANPTAPPDAPVKPKLAGNPDNLMAETLADVLKRETGGKGRVFGLSLKDRAAVLPAGKRPDGAYWFDGRFATSTYYRDSLPPWVQAFNASGAAERYFGKDWTRFRPDLDYAALAGPDEGLGEGKGRAQGTTFPHPTTGGKDKVGKEYYDAVATSPFGNDLLLDFAKACVTNEKLGRGDAPDLLTVSFSSNDLIGHAWGPDSQEVLDVTLRADALMADFLAFLDREVGAGQYTVVVTADHGVGSAPEVAAKKGLDAKRVSPLKVLLAAEKFMREVYGNPTADAKDPVVKKGTDDVFTDKSLWLEAAAPPHFYLNHRLLAAKGIDPAAAADKLAAWFATQPGIQRAYTAKQLVATTPPDDALTAQERMSFYAPRNGDVVVVPKPYWLFSSYLTGASHGTPHEYDTHATFLAYGPGIGGGRRSEKVTPLHASAILADALGVRPPKDAQYGLPATLAKP